MTFPAGAPAMASALLGDWNVIGDAGINPAGALGRRIRDQRAIAYDAAWVAWVRIGHALEDAWDNDVFLFAEPVRFDGSGNPVDFDDNALPQEPESESFTGEWLKDEFGIPYFRVYRESNPFLDDDYVDGTAMYGNHAIV